MADPAEEAPQSQDDDYTFHYSGPSLADTMHRVIAITGPMDFTQRTALVAVINPILKEAEDGAGYMALYEMSQRDAREASAAFDGTISRALAALDRVKSKLNAANIRLAELGAPVDAANAA